MTALEDDKALILAAARYRSGNDSINSMYMGSSATHSLYIALGGHILHDSLQDLLAKASPRQIAAGKKICQRYIDYMLKHPVKTCPCCGQITGTE